MNNNQLLVLAIIVLAFGSNLLISTARPGDNDNARTTKRSTHKKKHTKTHRHKNRDRDVVDVNKAPCCKENPEDPYAPCDLKFMERERQEEEEEETEQ